MSRPSLFVGVVEAGDRFAVAKACQGGDGGARSSEQECARGPEVAQQQHAFAQCCELKSTFSSATPPRHLQHLQAGRRVGRPEGYTARRAALHARVAACM